MSFQDCLTQKMHLKNTEWNIVLCVIKVRLADRLRWCVLYGIWHVYGVDISARVNSNCNFAKSAKYQYSNTLNVARHKSLLPSRDRTTETKLNEQHLGTNNLLMAVYFFAGSSLFIRDAHEAYYLDVEINYSHTTHPHLLVDRCSGQQSSIHACAEHARYACRGLADTTAAETGRLNCNYSLCPNCRLNIRYNASISHFLSLASLYDLQINSHTSPVVRENIRHLFPMPYLNTKISKSA